MQRPPSDDAPPLAASNGTLPVTPENVSPAFSAPLPLHVQGTEAEDADSLEDSASDGSLSMIYITSSDEEEIA